MSNELTVIERAKRALRTADHEPALVELAKSTADIVEIKNADGRTQAHSAYMSLKTRRTDIRKVGKAARDDATQFSKAVIAEEDRLVRLIEPEETRLQALRDAWDAAREAERVAKVEAEKQRKAALTKKVSDLREIPLNFVDAGSDKIQTAIDDLEAFEVTEAEFSELIDAAHLARKEVLNKLFDMRVAASAREIEARRIAAERELLAQERAEQEERERQAAAARAEQERIDNERRAAEEAILRAEREEEQRKLAAERAELARQQAELAAERQRIADEAAARQRAADEAAAAEQRERGAGAERERHATAVRNAAEHAARAAAENAVRNAAPAMLAALEEINSWLVCACIASAEDMAQSFPHMLEVTERAIAAARQTEALKEAA